MLSSYIIGLGIGIIISLIVFMVIRQHNIKKKLHKIDKMQKYTNNVSVEIHNLLGLILSYLNEKNPSKLLTQEVVKIVKREANKWGVRKDDTNNLWINIRSNISSGTNNPDRKGEPDN